MFSEAPRETGGNYLLIATSVKKYTLHLLREQAACVKDDWQLYHSLTT